MTNAGRHANLFFMNVKMKDLIQEKGKTELFDEWPEKYDQWFTTPIGVLVKRYEAELLLDLLKPNPGETILDAGCGTGVFTLDILAFNTHVIGIDISRPMLMRAAQKGTRISFPNSFGRHLTPAIFRERLR